MKHASYLLSGPAQQDIKAIREYTINKWGQAQWFSYKTALQARMQRIANTPNIGMIMDEVGSNAYRFPDNNHVFYYLKNDTGIIFVGILSHSLAPEKHRERVRNINVKK